MIDYNKRKLKRELGSLKYEIDRHSKHVTPHTRSWV